MSHIKSIDHPANMQNLIRAVMHEQQMKFPNADAPTLSGLCMYALAALATGAAETPTYMRIHVRAHIIELCEQGAAMEVCPI